MNKRIANNFTIKTFDEISLGGNNEDNQGQGENIDISMLHSFSNHPFSVLDDEKMDELCDSIEKNGIINPIIVREDDRGYEIISGHRRVYACSRLGLITIPAIIKQLDDDDASIIMVDSNIQREQVKVSEKAKAYRIKMNALNRKGQKQKDGKIDSTNDIALASGESRKQVSRYIRLSYLIDELLDMVDNKKIPAFTVGYELAFLTEEEQKLVYKYLINFSCKCNKKQAAKLRELSKTAELTQQQVENILFAENDNIKNNNINMNMNKIVKFFPKDTSSEEMEEVILELLEKWYEQKGKSNDE